ncbi:RNA polymerase II transcription factor B subunit 3 [Astathelohania contejeani]|uniref:RNA polymerase II transcription factor B subunit 3 n=1 Tax=Astathelohania contejeani TaxID=164912 RepID=A0ABQ7HXK4_9MICR|nr:RNA polymerase II transcription factor B subunit 3 [Thelohania contejeani]
MTDLQCPLCKSDSYINPSIKLYVSPCYHKMCETCLARIFSNGQAPCPECGVLLRKINYIFQTFEDITVERECKIRKTINRVCNRSATDFPTEDAYNDYLEAYEDLVDELMEYKNEKLINERIEKFNTLYKLHEEVKPKEVVIKKRKVVEEEIVIPPSYERILNRNIKLPDCFKVDYKVGGLTVEMLALKAIGSIFDDLIN